MIKIKKNLKIKRKNWFKKANRKDLLEISFYHIMYIKIFNYLNEINIKNNQNYNSLNHINQIFQLHNSLV